MGVTTTGADCEPRVDALLATEATVVGSRLDISGAGWNRLHLPSLPAVVDALALGIVVQYTTAQLGQEHELKVRLEGPNERPVVLADDGGADGDVVTALGLGFHPHPVPDAPPVPIHAFPIAINIEQVLLVEPGAYRFVVTLNGHQAAVVRFTVTTDQAAEREHHLAHGVADK